MTGALRMAVALLVAALCSGGLLSQAATAADNPALYGLRPALSGQTTLTGGHFSYALPAGAHLTDAVEVFNFSPGPLTIDLYAANVLAGPQGGFLPAQQGQPPTGATAWLAVKRATLSLTPRGHSVDRFSLAIPTGTPPGDYLAVIVGALAGGPRVAAGVVLHPRVALVVRVTVLGKTRPGLTLGHLRIQRHNDDAALSLPVTNTGNTLVTLRGAVDVKIGSRRVAVPLGPADLYVIPGGHTTLTGTWRNLPLYGRATLDATVSTDVSGLPLATYRAAPVRYVLVPWWRAGLVLASIGTAALTFGLTRKRRAIRQARRADERQVLAQYRASRKQ